ncbi:MAG: ABC transporter permease [Prevotella sp.]|nr:ABC transporter permease [Prevotella sp.]
MKKLKITNTTRQKLFLEISKYSLDMSKLVFGGIVLAGIMGLSLDKTLLFGVGMLAVIMLAIFGFVFFIVGNQKLK